MQDGEDLAAALRRIAEMPASKRNEIAVRGWNAVEQFNNATLDGWLNVLADTCGVRRTTTPLSRIAG